MTERTPYTTAPTPTSSGLREGNILYVWSSQERGFRVDQQISYRNTLQYLKGINTTTCPIAAASEAGCQTTHSGSFLAEGFSKLLKEDFQVSQSYNDSGCLA